MNNYIGYISNPNKITIILNFNVHECSGNNQLKRWEKQKMVSFIKYSLINDRNLLKIAFATLTIFCRN